MAGLKMLKKIVPAGTVRIIRRLQGRFALLVEYKQDRKRYASAAAPADSAYSIRVPARNIEAQLTKDYHRIEKGLALGKPRRPFGDAVVERIDRLLPVAERAPGGLAYLEHVRTARAALDDWNRDGNITADVSPVRQAVAYDPQVLRDFFESRHSVRSFSALPVPDSQVQEAVSYAINSPSVCNRQSWKVRVYSDAVGVETALSFQNGNKGFGAVPAVAIITSDLKLFSGPGERNQAWIEGGIFGMSVVWALHALRIDSCMLNFSEGNRQGDALRRSLDISDSEVIVMMIAMGYGAEGVRVARSPHRSIDEILTFESIRRPPTSRGEAATGRA